MCIRSRANSITFVSNAQIHIGIVKWNRTLCTRTELDAPTPGPAPRKLFLRVVVVIITEKSTTINAALQTSALDALMWTNFRIHSYFPPRRASERAAKRSRPRPFRHSAGSGGKRSASHSHSPALFQSTAPTAGAGKSCSKGVRVWRCAPAASLAEVAPCRAL